MILRDPFVARLRTCVLDPFLVFREKRDNDEGAGFHVEEQGMTSLKKHICQTVFPNAYFDSVTLMRISGELGKLSGIGKVSVMMGTPANLALLAEQELWIPGDRPVAPVDLCMAVEYETASDLATVKAALDTFLRGNPQKNNKPAGVGDCTGRSWLQAANALPEPKIAFISVPGPFAAVEAKLALEAGFDVFLFSDNVDMADEVALKQLAQKLGHVVMGPDCGTSLLSGARLGFVNHVRPGPVGIVAASGTGAQEVSSLLDQAGIGVSHIIGTGGRDLHESVGGITTRKALQWLREDEKTERIVLLAKPPAASVAASLVEDLKVAGKPAGVLFMGAKADSGNRSVAFCATLGELIAWACGKPEEVPPLLPRAPGAYIRALYVGGTFAFQAAGLMNLHPSAEGKPWVGPGHCVVDFGDDRFTLGRPHPMIDGSLRQEAIRETLLDPATGVVVCDVVLGDGAEADPAGRVADAVRRARAERSGRDFPAVVAHVVGTRQDPQGFNRQSECLREAGIVVTRTSTAAILAAVKSVGLTLKEV